ncbi:ribosome maturation factor RimP [Gehongia tenuis]|uniref:Ribosome maturation factor RimP n=1 Tax=Gehongia tenuis TaxID=2763655 RepID=A0A926HPW0_9FIRM|nr:ribosome maturation factor RimP [Gehongia tenuis]MBC8531110.1 ribosome maturation factor RimP [Gehongia tenuis]
MTKKSSMLEAIRSAAEPIIQALDMELVDVEYAKEGSDWCLFVFVDRPEGMSMNDVERATAPLNELLDEIDPIAEPYQLIVSSPGDRPLKTARDFERNQDKPVEVKLYRQMNGRKAFVGKLEAFGEQIMIRDEKDQVFSFDPKDVAVVRPWFTV